MIKGKETEGKQRRREQEKGNVKGKRTKEETFGREKKKSLYAPLLVLLSAATKASIKSAHNLALGVCQIKLREEKSTCSPKSDETKSAKKPKYKILRTYKRDKDTFHVKYPNTTKEI